jgi:HD-like signal output (HDOD) protein
MEQGHVHSLPGQMVPLVTDFDETAEPGKRLASLVLADIAAGTLVLASPLREITSQIRNVVVSASHPRRVARLAAMDPAVSAKLVRAANTHARRNGEPQVQTLVEATQKLGVTNSAGLIHRYTLHDNLTHPEPAIQDIARKSWQAALRVATISYLLASLDGRFNPEQAAMMGLLHNLGELALINRAAREEHPLLDAELKPALDIFAGEVGRELAASWSLSGGVIAINDHLGEWERDHGGSADTVDLSLIAQLHARLGQKDRAQLPSLAEVPAFAKLQLGEPSPRFSMQLLEAANNALALAQRSLTGV